MAQTWFSIAYQSLGVASPSVTFSSIPQTYRDLRLVVSVPTGFAGSGSGIQFNGDTNYSGNYSRTAMTGNGSVTSSFSNSGAGNPAGDHDLGALRADGMLTADILDYSATDKHKTVLSRAGGAGNDVWAIALRWASTSAVTSLVFTTDGSQANLPAGLTIALYGIAG